MMNTITRDEAEDELGVIILKDGTLTSAINAYEQKDHARLGAIISQHIEDSAIKSRARFIEALKQTFAASAGQSAAQNDTVHTLVRSFGSAR